MDEKKRSRKKQLFQDILKQVEFYFSPANLSKDRFMNQALTENKNGMELSVLLTFNKLKSLTTDINILKKALRLSEILELTENETRIKSKVAVSLKEDVDECTIYVERLPLDATVDFMRQVFIPFGPIDYVSLPKFNNGKIKGFGFVEFSNISGAQNAIEEFKKTGGYLSTEMAPGNLRSICTFDKKTKEKLLKSRTKNFDYNESANTSREEEDMGVVTEEIDQVELEAVKETSYDDSSDDNEKKRKNKTSPSVLERKKKKVKSDKGEDSGDLQIPKNALSDQSFEDADNGDLQNSSNEKIKQTEDDAEISEQMDDNNPDDENEKIKKKRRQKKKPKKDRLSANSGLLILSKHDWKKLRNKYLNMQWEKMKSLKKHLHRCKIHEDDVHSQNYQYESNNGNNHFEYTVEIPTSVVKITLNEPVIDIKQFKAQVKSKSVSVVNIDVKESSTEVHVRLSSAETARNFASNNDWKCQIISGDEELRYWSKIHQDRQNKQEKRSKKAERLVDTQDNGAAEETKPISKGLKEKPSLDIIPNTIVKVTIPEPITNARQFKQDMKTSCKDVIYVDVKEGSAEAYIRLDTAEKAQVFSSSNILWKAHVLTGAEEQTYWDKINEDRTNKFEKNVRVKKRGKQKIMKKAENMMGKHIILEDMDDA